MARGYRRRSRMGAILYGQPDAGASQGKGVVDAVAVDCSHEKDHHGWQHEVRDLARPLGSI